MKYFSFMIIIGVLFVGCNQSQIHTQTPKVVSQPKVIIKRVEVIKEVEKKNPYEVTKSVCMISDKPLKKVKKELLYRVKKEINNDIFANLVKLNNKKISAKTMKLLKLKDDIKYYNGKDLAEVCVKVTGYVNKSDVEKYKLKPISNHFCYANGSISLKEMKKTAINKGYISLIQKIKPSLNISAKEAKKLLYDVNISNKRVNIDTYSYCFNISAKVSVAQIENYKSKKLTPTIYKNSIDYQKTFNNLGL